MQQAVMLKCRASVEYTEQNCMLKSSEKDIIDSLISHRLANILQLRLRYRRRPPVLYRNKISTSKIKRKEPDVLPYSPIIPARVILLPVHNELRVNYEILTRHPGSMSFDHYINLSLSGMCDL